MTPDGLVAEPHFLYFLFPIMLAILVILLVGLAVGKTELRRPFGYVLLGFYVVYIAINTI